MQKNKSGQFFGVTIMSLWVGFVFSIIFPVKDNATNVAIVSVSFFVIAAIIDILSEKNKLF